MSDIPEARGRLNSLINYVMNSRDELDADYLLMCMVDIEGMLYRKPPIRKAEAQSQPMTPELAEKIRAFAKRNPDMSFQSIGYRFNVNAGRITEALQDAEGDIL